jgi:chemotaxis protein histidine kinase CheA
MITYDNLFNTDNELIILLDELENIIYLNSTSASILKLKNLSCDKKKAFRSYFSAFEGFSLPQVLYKQKIKMSLKTRFNFGKKLDIIFSIEPISGTVKGLWIARAPVDESLRHFLKITTFPEEKSFGINQHSFRLFASESKKIIETLSVEKGKLPILSNNLKRSIHTLKTGADIFKIFAIRDICLRLEKDIFDKDLITSARKLEQVKDNLLYIEKFHDFFQQDWQPYLNISLPSLKNNRMNFLENSINNLTVTDTHEHFFNHRLTNDLEPQLVPIETLIAHYVKWITHLGQQLKKNIAPLKLTHEPIMVRAGIYNSLFLNISHALKNAVDHGIESVEERKKLGKKEFGEIEISIRKSKADSPQLKIEIIDDGRGFNFDHIRNKLSTKGSLISKSQSNPELLEEIFKHQLSTKENDNGISGQGVGLNALAGSVQALSGKIWIESCKKNGATIHIEVPYTHPFQEPKFTNDEAA